MRRLPHLAVFGRVALAGMLVLASHGRAHADEALDLPHAVALGAAQGPGVKTAAAPRADYQAARDAARVFFTLPPRLSFMAGPRIIDGVLRPEIVAGIYQDMPLSGLGRARAATADALVAATDAATERARLDAELRAGLAWIAVREAEEILALRHAASDAARELARILGARVNAGTTKPAEAAIADAEVALAATSELDGEGALVEARSELRIAIATTSDRVLVGDLRSADETPADEASAMTLARASHPALVSLRRRAAVYESDAGVQRGYQAPLFTFGVQWSREGTGEQTLLGSVVFPLPFSRSGDYEAARAHALADTEREAEVTETARVEEAVRLALHERSHTREVRRTAQTAATAFAEAERLARAAVDTGTDALPVLLLARTRRIASDERLIRAFADVLRADLKFGHAIGRIPWRPGT
jgi:outer membrane protein TolC